jgi:hypothetical protein
MYGVDQCRVCGKKIVVKSPKTLEEQLKAIRKPIVPEKVWRARGYLTVPTHAQWRANPADGCCGACGLIEMRKKFHHVMRFWLLMGGAVVVTTVVVSIIKFLPH